MHRALWLLMVPLVAEAQQLPRWTLAREMVIDGAAHQLVPVGPLVVDTGGRIYFGQNLDHNIRVFGPDGTPRRTIGRFGSGPGEWRGRVHRMGFVGDSLWTIPDGEGGRITIFPRDGQQVRITPTPEVRLPTTELVGASGFFRHARAVYPGGAMLISVAPGAGQMSKVVLPSANPLLRVEAKATPRVIAREPTSEGSLRITGAPGVGACYVGIPFASSTQMAVSVDGSAVALARALLSGDSAGFVRVTVVRGTGETVFSSLVPASMEPIPRARLDSAFAPANVRGSCASITTTRPDAPSARTRAMQALDTVARPRFYPPLSRVTVARDGAVLLAFAAIDGKRDHLVVDPRGKPAGQIVLPANVTLWQLEGDLLWGVEKDIDDVPSVVRYRINKR